jgi:PA domain
MKQFNCYVETNAQGKQKTGQIVCKPVNQVQKNIVVKKVTNKTTTQKQQNLVKNSCCDGAKFTTNFVLDNAIFQSELGNGFVPPDPIMAIGPTVAIAMTNSLIGYYQRPSMTRTNLETMQTLLNFGATGGGGDVQVIYDEFSSRFFALGWVNATVSATLTINSPSSVAGVYDARKMVNSTLASFPIGGEIVATDPVDCYDVGLATWAITPACQAAISGKIALIKRRSATLPLGPGNNAVSVASLVRSYGAIGVIIYNDVNGPIPNFGGLSVTPSYPQIGISLQDGLALAGAYGSYPPFPSVSPLNGTLTTLPSSIVKNYMNIAVSKNSTPLSTNDWYKYQFTTNRWLTANVTTDYPKIAVDEDKFYITTQDIGSGIRDAVVSVLNKTYLVNNTAPTFIDDSSSTFISQELAANNYTPQPARIVYSCYKNYLPQFFLTLANYDSAANIGRLLNAATGLRVWIGTSMNQFIDVSFPVPTQIDSGARAKQPLSSTGTSSFGLDTWQQFVMTAVIYKNSIFAAHTILNGANRSIIRWYELDVSKAVSYGVISIKQWGNIDTCESEESCFQPCINVNKCGDMAVTFTISGPNRLPSFAYTGRLKKDPLGTVRTPYEIIKVSPYPYNGSSSTITYTTGPVTGNRWKDYDSVVVDPNDHKTFFTFSQVSSDDLPPALPTDVNATKQSLKWTTVMSSFNIDKSCGTETSPGESCPPEPPAPQLIQMSTNNKSNIVPNDNTFFGRRQEQEY